MIHEQNTGYYLRVRALQDLSDTVKQKPVRNEQEARFGGIKEEEIDERLKALETGQVGAPVASLVELQEKLKMIEAGGSGFVPPQNIATSSSQ
jgi:hypothetical protein